MEYKVKINDSESGLAKVTVYSRLGNGEWSILCIWDMVNIPNDYLNNTIFKNENGERVYPEIIDLRT